MVRKFLAFILSAILLTANASAADLYVGFTRLNTDTPPAIVDGRMLVPLRAFFEALGATVVWNPDTHTATAYYNYTPVAIQVDSNIAYVNGEPHTLDVPAQLINGRTMVPARFIAEAFNRDVTWHQETHTAAIESRSGDDIYVTEGEDSFHYSDSCNGNTYYKATWAEVLGRKLQPCEECVPFAIRSQYQPNFNAPDPDNSTAEGTEADSSASSGDSSPSSGSWGQSSTTNGTTDNLNHTVYWVPGGKSYHFSSGCRSLARSKNIQKGTLQDALNAGKTDPCNNCAGGR